MEALSCNLDALTREQRTRHIENTRRLMQARRSVRELPDGYALQYDADIGTVLALADFIALEHRCCPFFHLALEVESGDGAAWLKITGADPIKQFAAAEMGLG